MDKPSRAVYRRVFAVLGVLALLEHGVCTNCPTVELRNALVERLEGRYSMMSDNCTNRPTYENGDSLYDLYYEGPFWIVYGISCLDDDLGYARARSTAQYPENISVEFWEERDSVLDDWTISYDLHIVCAPETTGSSSSGLSAGAIAGIVIGAVAVVVLIYVIHKCHSKTNPSTAENNTRTDNNSTRSPTNPAVQALQEVRTTDSGRVSYSGFDVAMHHHQAPADESPAVSDLAPPPSYDEATRNSSYSMPYDNMIAVPDHVSHPSSSDFHAMKTGKADGTDL